MDPALPAPGAPVSWLTSAAAPLLEAACDRPPPGVVADLACSGLRCEASLIVGPAQEENVILRDSDKALTLRLHGSRASLAPVATTFLIAGLPAPSKLAADFATLDRLLQCPRSRVHRSRDRLLLRDAIVSLDGRDAGGSHREAAEVIFGIKRVRADWSARGGWMKERMRRALAKGEEMRDGGYRRALDGACRLSR